MIYHKKVGNAFVAFDGTGRAGSVLVHDGVVVSEDAHLLASITPEDHYLPQIGVSARPCVYLDGRPSYCDGSGMARYPYTTDEAMFSLAEARLP